MTEITAAGHEPAPSAEHRERVFFFVMAWAIALTVVAGFGSYVALGISSFAAPWWVHLHAVSFSAWIGLYMTQNFLALRGNLDRHRQLGRIGAGLATWMVLVAVVLTPVTLAANRVPPIFTPSFFLALDWVNITCFAALVYAALHFRNRTDWHRRLMLCATICVIAPAWGRLLSLGGTTTEWSNIGALLVYVAVAMIADWRIRGRVHTAYYWGFGAIFMMAPVISGLAGFPPLIDLATRLAG